MNRLMLSFVFFMILIGVTSAQAVEQPVETVLLEDISFEKSSDNSERLFFKLNGSIVPKVFGIKGDKPRLVIDFFNTESSITARNNFRTDGQLTKGVRVGIHNNPLKTRVVVDMATDQEFVFDLSPEDRGHVIVLSFYLKGAKEDPAPEQTGKKKDPGASIISGHPGQNIDSLEKQVKTVEAEPSIPQPAAVREQSSIPVETVTSSPSVNKVGNEHDDRKSADKESEVQLSGAEDRVDQIIAEIKDPKPSIADPILLDVSFESTANESEMVLFRLNDFYPPIVFGIEKGNPRVVCDFLDTRLADTVQPVIQSEGLFVSRIRTARHPSPEKVRVVLDLVPNRNYDLQQVFFKEDNLFVIIISEFEGVAGKSSKTVPESVEAE